MNRHLCDLLRSITFQLYKIDLKGGNPTQLTYEGDNLDPDWFNPFYTVSP